MKTQAKVLCNDMAWVFCFGIWCMHLNVNDLQILATIDMISFSLLFDS